MGDNAVQQCNEGLGMHAGLPPGPTVHACMHACMHAGLPPGPTVHACAGVSARASAPGPTSHVGSRVHICVFRYQSRLLFKKRMFRETDEAITEPQFIALSYVQVRPPDRLKGGGGHARSPPMSGRDCASAPTRQAEGGGACSQPAHVGARSAVGRGGWELPPKTKAQVQPQTQAHCRPMANQKRYSCSCSGAAACTCGVSVQALPLPVPLALQACPHLGVPALCDCHSDFHTLGAGMGAHMGARAPLSTCMCAGCLPPGSSPCCMLWHAPFCVTPQIYIVLKLSDASTLHTPQILLSCAVLELSSAC
eukprot:363986-Chlamydomonas_euryale.AAC.18